MDVVAGGLIVAEGAALERVGQRVRRTTKEGAQA
jgi:hypothetical protein